MSLSRAATSLTSQSPAMSTEAPNSDLVDQIELDGFGAVRVVEKLGLKDEELINDMYMKSN